jgi:Ca2+-binding RTX toxin-like protein
VREAILGHELLEQRRLLAVAQITLNASLAQIEIRGTTGEDQVVVSYEGANSIKVHAVTNGEVADAVFLQSAVSMIDFAGGDGNDRFENLTSVRANARGDAGNDTLIGGAGNDILFGGLGDDLLVGNQGDDVLHGQEGHDQVFGGEGNDLLTGSFGNDYLSGGTGNDSLYGEADHDELHGGDGDDYLDGQDGNDLLYGGGNNDYLLAGTGNDTLYGGAGDDQLHGQDDDDYVDGQGGNDRLTGGTGDDQLLGGSGNDELYGEDGNDQLRGQEGDDRLDGQGGNDLLVGGLGNDVLYGGLGDDLLFGSQGDDVLYGQGGNDQLFGSAGVDRLNGGIGADYLSGGVGNDTLYGEADDDELHGDAGDDYVDGQAGDDRLFGELGNDYLLGGIGDDVLVGNQGDDQVHGQEGNDRVFGSEGNDILTGSFGNDYLSGGTGNDSLYGEAGDDELHGGDGDDNLQGQDGNDLLYGGGNNDYLLAGTGNDTLYGGAGDDELHGQEDIDYIDGQGGNDRLTGGTGNDQLFGGSGNDNLYGEDGDDQLNGQDGDDHLDGQNGNDMLTGGLGNDELFGGIGDDWLIGDEGNDVLHGQDGNDFVFGLAGNDYLTGGFGNDVLWGGAGNDTLLGEADDDVLVGDDGDDSLSGGGGNDVMIGGGGADQLTGSIGDDLLVGGRTTYDGNYQSLETLRAVWTSGASYSTRIATIQSSSFAAQLESEVTVFEDQVPDELIGGDGEDWFIQTGYLGIYDPVGGANDGDDDHGSFVSSELPYLEGFALIDSLDVLSDRQTSEAVHSKVPHADSSVLQREHLALFELVRYDQVTHYAVTNGAWSNPSTWQNGIVPGNGARVLIPIGVEVTVNGVIAARLHTVRIDGTLKFSTTANSELRVDTMIGTGSSLFEMGSAAQPIPTSVTARLLITDNGPIDRNWDPFGISRGLISHGSVSMHGAVRASHVTLLGGAFAGTSQLALASVPTGWRPGDSIVVAGTTEGAEQNEVRTIASIIGNLVFLSSPLTYNHIPPETELSVHVANLTRNVVIDSENWAVDRRGHTMFMHNRGVDVAYAAFNHLGRTNKLQPINDPVVDANWNLQPGTGTNPRARYSVHFHRNGLVNDGDPAVVRGSVVVDSPGWGFVNHSSYVDILNSVAFDVSGAAFATEVGDEIGSFDGNIAIGSTGSGLAPNARENIQDFGHQGDGFWFQGAGISVTNNVSAGNEGNAFAYYTRGLVENGVTKKFLTQNLTDPSIANGASTIPVGLVPVMEFSNNVGYASSVGLMVRYHLENATHGQGSVIENSVFWNNTNGVQDPYTQNTTFRDLKIIHGPGGSPYSGVEGNLVTRDNVYDNLTVTGYFRGIYVPRTGSTIIRGGYWDNDYDILMNTGISPTRSVLLTGVFTELPRVFMDPYFAPQGGSINHVFYQDTVIADYGPFNNQRLYYKVQAAGAVPFPTAGSGIPAQYVGRTTQQLWNLYAVAVGGAIAPANAVEVPLIAGLVGPPM